MTRKILSAAISLFLMILLSSCAASKESTKISNSNGSGEIELKAVSRQVGGISIRVDPRIELLAAVQFIGGYDKRYHLITRLNFSYKNDIKSHFSRYSEHEAVKLFDTLSIYGFSFDAPPTFMLYLSNPMKLNRILDYGDYFTGRAGKADLDKFALQLQKFGENSSFDKFYEAHKELYQAVVDNAATVMAGEDYIDDLEKYYGMKQNRYNIILSPMFHTGGFATKIEVDGSYDIYSIQGPYSVEKDIPLFGNRDSFKYLVWHEFSHSFVNPLTEENLNEVDKYNKLYEPVAENMKANAYPNWETCTNEHIVRAVTARLVYKHNGQSAYENVIAEEKKRGFLYITQLAEELKEYEKNRDKYVSLKEFYPKLVEAFSKLSELE